MNAMLYIVFFLSLGIAFGFIVREQKAWLAKADNVGMLAVYVLLFVLGARLGADASLFARLPEFGGVAFVMALFCSAGSVFFVVAAERLFSSFTFGPCQQKNVAVAQKQTSALWGSAKIVSFFVCGIALARIGVLPLWLCDEHLAEYALWVLVLSVGLGLGGNISVFFMLRTMKGKLLCVPLLVAAGSLFGGALAILLLPLTLQEALSVSAGFGYYSLSSLIISETGQAALASIALIANIFRELLGILTAQLAARYCGPLAPIAIGRATAMDTRLPVIARFCGDKFVLVAVFSGMALSMLVPFLVTLILSL